jgi:hypothetical protein
MPTPTYQQQAAVLTKGEAIYLEKLRPLLERDHEGEYVAINVDTEEYLIDKSRMKVVLRAQQQFSDKLFYTVRVGNLVEPTINFKNKKHVAWLFS